jgi:hypothetical protein
MLPAAGVYFHSNRIITSGLNLINKGKKEVKIKILRSQLGWKEFKTSPPR